MKNKDEVFNKFKEFKALCKDSGIKRELTTPYNPQQNGVVERKNKTIMEATKEMLHDQDLHMHLWAEVARTMVYCNVLDPPTGEEDATIRQSYGDLAP